MREINREEGRVYSIGEFYYLEKIYKDLAHLIKDEVRIKKRARDNKFTVLSSSWGIKENLFYDIESVFSKRKKEKASPVNFILTVELKYK